LFIFSRKIGNKEKLDYIINLTDNEAEKKESHKCQKVDNFNKNNEKIIEYLKSL